MELRRVEELSCKYIIFGREMGEKGTPHLQGYIELNNPMRWNTLNKKMGGRVHLEERRGSQEEAIKYCKKEGDWWEKGKPGKMGERNDIKRIKEIAKNSGIREVAKIGNYNQIRLAEKYMEYCEESRKWKPYVYWLWGKTSIS